MGKRDRKRARPSEAAGAKAEARQQQIEPSGKGRSRRSAIWPVVAIVVVATAVAWLVMKDRSSPGGSDTVGPELTESLAPPAGEGAASRAVSDTGVSAARLEIPEPEFDFGFVPQSAKVSHVFWLHAAGEDTLRILKVNPG